MGMGAERQHELRVGLLHAPVLVAHPPGHALDATRVAVDLYPQPRAEGDRR